jgi:hypothetical protein
MTPHQLADIIRRAHAIGEHPENQCWTHVYPREWQDMIVAALEAFGAAQAGREAPGWIDAAALQAAREIAAVTWTYTSKVPAIQGIVARKMMRAALEGAAKDPGCYICGTVVTSTSRTLGSSIDLLIGLSFKHVETLNANAKHKYYRECGCCGGTDENRDHYKPDIWKVQHVNDCTLARDLPILRAIGLASDASPHSSTEDK